MLCKFIKSYPINAEILNASDNLINKLGEKVVEVCRINLGLYGFNSTDLVVHVILVTA